MLALWTAMAWRPLRGVLALSPWRCRCTVSWWPAVLILVGAAVLAGLPGLDPLLAALRSRLGLALVEGWSDQVSCSSFMVFMDSRMLLLHVLRGPSLCAFVLVVLLSFRCYAAILPGASAWQRVCTALWGAASVVLGPCPLG